MIGIIVFIGIMAFWLWLLFSVWLGRPLHPRTKSEMTKHILNEYYTIPESYRTEDISKTLRAMDKKYGVGKVSDHFKPYVYIDDFGCTSMRYSGLGPCEEDFCKPYRHVLDGVKALQKSVKRQEKALSLSSEHNLGEALSERLFDNAKIMDEVTKELT